MLGGEAGAVEGFEEQAHAEALALLVDVDGPPGEEDDGDGGGAVTRFAWDDASNLVG